MWLYGIIHAINLIIRLKKRERDESGGRERERQTIIANQEGVFSVLHNTPSYRDGTLDVLEAAHGTNIMCLSAKQQLELPHFLNIW